MASVVHEREGRADDEHHAEVRRQLTTIVMIIALRSHYGFDSFVCIPVRPARMRRAAWKARSAGSAAAT